MSTPETGQQEMGDTHSTFVCLDVCLLLEIIGI